jgi:alkylhydroperoxidase/carboxymuconolactone decarboxylase family protein YurZ
MTDPVLQQSFGLTDEDVETLRRGYQRDLMLAATRGALSQVYPQGAGYVGAIVDAIYTSGPLTPEDRERCLIAILGTRQEALNLAIHIYWGLMEGLTLDEIGRTLLMAGAYAGLPAYSAGLIVMKKACGVMKAVLTEDPAAAVSQKVVGALMKLLGQ